MGRKSRTPRKARIEDEDVFEVEKIVDKRTRNGTTEYLISWKGFESSHDSWEPAANFAAGLKVALKEFNEEKKRRSSSKRKRSRSRASTPASSRPKRGQKRRSSGQSEPQSAPRRSSAKKSEPRTKRSRTSSRKASSRKASSRKASPRKTSSRQSNSRAGRRSRNAAPAEPLSPDADWERVLEETWQKEQNASLFERMCVIS